MPYDLEAEARAAGDKPLRLSDYQQHLLNLARTVGTTGYEALRGVPGFKELVAGARSLGDGTYAGHLQNLEQYEIENPSLAQRAYQMSEVEPGYPAHGDPESQMAARQALSQELAMNMAGGMKVKGPAGFLTPKGIFMTGQYHDINKLPEPYSLGEDLDKLVGGFADEYGPFVSQKQIDQYLASPKEGYWPKTPANEPASPVDFSGPEVIGKVGPGGGMAFRGGEHGEGRYFSRAPDEPMPTSGLPDMPALTQDDMIKIAYMPALTQDDMIKIAFEEARKARGQMDDAARARGPRSPGGENQFFFPPTQVIDIKELYDMFGKKHPKWTPEE